MSGNGGFLEFADPAKVERAIRDHVDAGGVLLQVESVEFLLAEIDRLRAVVHTATAHERAAVVAYLWAKSGGTLPGCYTSHEALSDAAYFIEGGEHHLPRDDSDET